MEDTAITAITGHVNKHIDNRVTYFFVSPSTLLRGLNADP